MQIWRGWWLTCCTAERGNGSRFRPLTSLCHEHRVETEPRTLSTNQRVMEIVSVPMQLSSTLITPAKSQRSASEPVDLEKRTQALRDKEILLDKSSSLATSLSCGCSPERMLPLRLGAGAGGDNAETRGVMCVLVCYHLRSGQKSTIASSKYTHKKKWIILVKITSRKRPSTAGLPLHC